MTNAAGPFGPPDTHRQIIGCKWRGDRSEYRQAAGVGAEGLTGPA
jgi:hypothetical protein